MKAAILADGGPRVGLGHLGRCTALAQAMDRFHGVKPIFLLKEPKSRRWVHNKGFSTRPSFNGSWDLLVVDSYHLSMRDLLSLRRSTRVLAMVDDLGRVPVACEWVLNSSVYAHTVRYTMARTSGLLLGPKFHPLRMEYWRPRASRPVREEVRDVLVMLGGTNEWGLLEKVVSVARRVLSEARYHLVAGPFGALSVMKNDDRVIIHRSPKNLRPLLERCDMAISGGGQSLYELAYVGLPAVAVCLAENQTQNVAGFQRAGTILVSGQPEERGFYSKLARGLSVLGRDRSLRERMSHRGWDLVDENGALRVADSLLKGMKE